MCKKVFRNVGGGTRITKIHRNKKCVGAGSVIIRACGLTNEERQTVG